MFLPFCCSCDWLPRNHPYIMGGFICTFSLSISLSITLWTSKFTSSSRCNWTGISTVNSNGSWNDKHSCHFSTAKEIRVKATFFFMWQSKQTNLKMMVKWWWNPSELVICKWWTDQSLYSRMELVDKRCRWNPPFSTYQGQGSEGFLDCFYYWIIRDLLSAT